jgi:hypothetical protein
LTHAPGRVGGLVIEEIEAEAGWRDKRPPAGVKVLKTA